MDRFDDRRHAGRLLGAALERHVEADASLLVLALPRGGVPVGYEVACTLHAALDVFIVRKLGVPGQRELAMGAIATGNVVVLNHELIWELQIPRSAIEAVIAAEQRELARREQEYRGARQRIAVSGKTAILVDDGLATGSTMQAAVEGLRKLQPARIVVAVPVAARPTCEEIGSQVDDSVCLLTPEPFIAVGFWYEDFEQTSDDEVRELLARASEESAPAHDCPRDRTLRD
jgi:putative phosphoribosyl transferase